jgi:hypothetical protein
MYTEETSFTLTHTHSYIPTSHFPNISHCCALFLLSKGILFARQLFNSKDDFRKYLYKVLSVYKNIRQYTIDMFQ